VKLNKRQWLALRALADETPRRYGGVSVGQVQAVLVKAGVVKRTMFSVHGVHNTCRSLMDRGLAKPLYGYGTATPNYEITVEGIEALRLADG